MVEKQAIIEALTHEDMGTKELTEKFGKYPRKKLSLLIDAGIVEKFKIQSPEPGKYHDIIQYRLIERQDTPEEIEEAVEKNTELLNEYAPAPSFSEEQEEEPEKEKKGWFRRLFS